jgi:kanamycin kinase
MIHTPVKPDLSAIPEQFHPYFTNSNVFDSSSSRAARVFYLDHGPGYYLKTAQKGTLKKEAEMTVFFHQKALATEVLAYESLENDWMLTLKADGEDCIDPRYLSDPIRLCDKTAEILSMPGRLYMLCMMNTEGLNKDIEERFSAVEQYVAQNGGTIIYLTPERLTASDNTYNIDAKTMKTMLRADFGLVELENGIIVGKYNYRDIPY